MGGWIKLESAEDVKQINGAVCYWTAALVGLLWYEDAANKQVLEMVK